MHANEYHLKAAHKVPHHQQLKAGVLEGFLKCLKNRLFALDFQRPTQAGLAQAPREWCYEQCRKAQQHQGLLPAENGDKVTLYWHH